MSIYRRFTVYFLLSVCAACNRPTDYLHRVVHNSKQTVAMNSKIKEMQGLSKLDVLWVIDNSGSMQTHQQRVIDNTADFMKAFTTKKALDWKMGLLSTHRGDKPYVGFGTNTLDARTPDPTRKFQDAVRGLGWNQGCPELVFEPVMDALSAHPDFSRSRSVLALLALTDTMEEQAGMQNTFQKFLHKEKGDMKYVKFYGTFAGESFACQSWEPRWLYPGSPFEYFVKLTGSKVYNLCSKDFGTDLAKLGEDIANVVTYSKIMLGQRPYVSTLQVFHKGRSLIGGPQGSGGEWYYDFDLNAVVFYDLDFAKDDDETIDVLYTADIE